MIARSLIFGHCTPQLDMKKTASLHFPRIRPIAYEGTKTSNALAFRHYNPEEVVDGQTMEAHMRFSIAYWHSFQGVGSDPFGPGTIKRPWEKGKDPVSIALTRMDAGRLGVTDRAVRKYLTRAILHLRTHLARANKQEVGQ